MKVGSFIARVMKQLLLTYSGFLVTRVRAQNGLGLEEAPVEKWLRLAPPGLADASVLMLVAANDCVKNLRRNTRWIG